MKRAHELAMALSHIFENTTDKLYELARLAKWYEKVRESAFKVFNTVARSIQNHYETIVNYFGNRSEVPTLSPSTVRRTVPKSKLSELNLEG